MNIKLSKCQSLELRFNNTIDLLITIIIIIFYKAQESIKQKKKNLKTNQNFDNNQLA